MADIQYLNYGDQQIEQQALLNNLANNVQSYVQNQPWSNKRKEKFMSAYSDLMNRGILGASNSTGQWMIDVGGDALPFDTMSKKDKEMYQEAAYFIQQQMQGLPTKASEEEQKEKEKSELPKYDNFSNSFIDYISQNYYGGNPIRTQEDWNVLDERNSETGLRGTDNRVKRLSDYLKAYSDSLEEGKYNFEGSPFKDLNDLKTKINTAITKLNDGTWNQDDTDALNAIGLRSSDWFNNGSGDTTKIRLEDGTERELTYAELAEYNNLIEQNKQKQLGELKEKQRQEQLAKYKKELANRFDQIRRIKAEGNDIGQISKKYKTDAELVNALNEFAKNGGTNGRSNEELNDITGAFIFYNQQGRLQNLTPEEMSRFKGFANYKNISPGVIKKLPGVNGFYFDTRTNQVIFASKKSENTSDLLAQANPDKNPRGQGIELTAADKRDIAATVADLASIVNPEIISGTITALGASTLRTWNSIEDRGVWDTLTDWKTWADWGTGALGGTPLLGDSSSLVKFARGLGKLMTIPAIGSAIANVPEAKQAWDKINFSDLESLKKLTPQDFHAISSVLIGVLSGKNYLKGNLAERKVLQESGFSTQAKTKRREYANKFGLTRTKVAENTTTPTLKAKINDKDVEINLTKEQQNIIQEKVKDAGNSAEARNKAVKEQLKGKEYTTKEGTKVKIDESSKIEVASPRKYLDKRWVNAITSRVGTSRNIFGTNVQPSTVDPTKNLETYLSNRSTWDQYKPWSLGTNSNLRRIAEVRNLNVTSQQNSQNGSQTQKSEYSKPTSPPTGSNAKPRSSLSKAESQEIQSTMRGKNFSTNKPLLDQPTSVKGFGDIYFMNSGKGNQTLTLELANGQKFEITSLIGNKQDNLKLLQKAMKSIDPKLPKDQKSRIKLEVIRKLKTIGALKQGGKITDTQIDNFLKQYK